jgi:hypothetical protein
MEPHFGPPPPDPHRAALPSLPIISAGAPRKSEAEKYGSLFYLGIAGLVVLVGLVAYFGYGVWSLRDVWANIYRLHSKDLTEVERVQAAYDLSREPRVTQRDYWEMCLRKPLPPLARYLLAERISAATVAADPRAYALVVSRSEGWPDWLRAQLARPLAYAAADGVAIPREPLQELSRNPDPAVALWADFALACQRDGEAARRLETRARAEGPDRAFAQDLLDALGSGDAARRTRLDEASLWLRRHHRDSARVWQGWRIDGDRVTRDPAPAPELHPEG